MGNLSRYASCSETLFFPIIETDTDSPPATFTAIHVVKIAVAIQEAEHVLAILALLARQPVTDTDPAITPTTCGETERGGGFREQIGILAVFQVAPVCGGIIQPLQ
jgi:hypothetical protein